MSTTVQYTDTETITIGPACPSCGGRETILVGSDCTVPVAIIASAAAGFCVSRAFDSKLEMGLSLFAGILGVGATLKDTNQVGTGATNDTTLPRLYTCKECEDVVELKS